MSIDPRNIATGWEIPTESYSDQPYIVRTDDGAWLCTLTTGAGHEGAGGQHVVSQRSTDHGQTWTPPLDVEPANGPEASYAVLLKVPSGRIYCFYNHNSDNVRWVHGDPAVFPDGRCTRVDSLGHYVFRYTDDHGHSWSRRRYDVPVRAMDIDRGNADGGKLCYFWNVGRPFVREGAVYCSLHKVGGFGAGFFTRSEGVLLRSENILTEHDPEKLVWETLPEGEAGLRAPAGGAAIAEEQSYSLLSDGSIFCVYRTVDGWPACSTSRDGGRTWDPPAYHAYADGRRIKHPRAANFAWRCTNGKFLYWFHNHGGPWIPRLDPHGYENRNPVWLCGGVEAESPQGKVIRWSQPEIILYDDDPMIRISYPDLVEEDGKYFLTETQKDVARVHHISTSLVEGLWGQFEQGADVTEGLLLELRDIRGDAPASVEMARLPDFVCRDYERLDFGSGHTRAGFTFDLWLKLTAVHAGQTLFDSRRPDGAGFCLRTATRGRLEVLLHDGQTDGRWCSEPGILLAGQRQHIVVIVDGGPCIISMVVDGRLLDGGDAREFGWGRFSRFLRGADGAPFAKVASNLRGCLARLRIYGRALRTSEAIANFHAGQEPQAKRESPDSVNRMGRMDEG